MGRNCVTGESGNANVTPGWSPDLRAQSCHVVVVVVEENGGGGWGGGWVTGTLKHWLLLKAGGWDGGGESMKLFTTEKNLRQVGMAFERNARVWGPF